jgi:Tol biopolymer transport system component
MISARLTAHHPRFSREASARRRAAGRTAAITLLFALAACADVQAPGTPSEPAAALTAPGAVVPGSMAFMSNRTGRDEVFVMNPGGDHVTQLTFSPADEALDNLRIEWIANRPLWSPDGRKLLFTRRAWDLSVTPNVLIHDVHILDLEDADPRPRRLMTNPTPSGAPGWSPDGQKVAYCSANAGSNEIWIFDITTSAYTRTNSGPGCWPDWSPDGSTIAFQTPAPRARIALLDVATGAVSDLTTQSTANPANDFYPRFSPDGEWVAFSSGRDKDVNGVRYQSIFLVPADGSAAPVNITPLPAGQAATGWTSQMPAWSNNGKYIYFNGTRPGTTGTQVFRTDLAGTEAIPVTDQPYNNAQGHVRPIVRP